MKPKCYINGIGVVGPQGIWREDLWENATELRSGLVFAQQPSYKELIPATMIRRMSKGIKMGIFAAQQAIDEAEIVELDAIVTGTGLGCLEDSEKFLRSILDNEEEFLTPTSFVQSTHNTVGAQIALRLGCKAYNVTYVSGTVSFESALLDSSLQLKTGEATHILVGGVDEIFGQTFELKKLIQEVKSDDVQETLRQSTTAGVNFGEGATFFVLSSEKSSSTYAELVDVHFQNNVERADIAEFVTQFLENHQVKMEEMSVLVTGNNGDIVYDAYYEAFGSLFPHATQAIYKNIAGQSDVASAFGLAAAAYTVKYQMVPPILRWGDFKQSAMRYVLLYNQYLGKDHSLTLIRHVEA